MNLQRKAVNLQINERKTVGRSKKTWRARVKKDMKLLNISKEAAHDRMKWLRLIACSTPIGRKGQRMKTMMILLLLLMMICMERSFDYIYVGF